MLIKTVDLHKIGNGCQISLSILREFERINLHFSTEITRKP